MFSVIQVGYNAGWILLLNATSVSKAFLKLCMHLKDWIGAQVA